MYAVETSKMSPRGQLVIPDAFRKSYGWKAGMTMLLIGTADAVVLQPLQSPNESSVDRILSDARAVGMGVADRVKKAETSLAKLRRLGIILPDGVEKGEGRPYAQWEGLCEFSSADYRSRAVCKELGFVVRHN